MSFTKLSSGAVSLAQALFAPEAWYRAIYELSYVPGPGCPEAFYRCFGFCRNGKVDEGEIALELDLRGNWLFILTFVGFLGACDGLFGA